jgi:hypothetical protein
LILLHIRFDNTVPLNYWGLLHFTIFHCFWMILLFIVHSVFANR